MTAPSYVFWPGLIAIGVMFVVIFLVGVWASRGRNTSGTADQELVGETVGPRLKRGVAQ